VPLTLSLQNIACCWVLGKYATAIHTISYRKEKKGKEKKKGKGKKRKGKKIKEKKGKEKNYHNHKQSVFTFQSDGDGSWYLDNSSAEAHNFSFVNNSRKVLQSIHGNKWQ